jgi:hypothetical protein
MSDGRWFEIEGDVTAAMEHFARSLELLAEGGFEDAGLAGYRSRMALMHAMQAGHTSLESALVRALRLLQEEPPTGNDWHADLIRRVSSAVAGRPALLIPELAKAATATRRFRHVAMRSYGPFDLELSRPAVLAAGVIVRDLQGAIAAFKAAIDPSIATGTHRAPPPGR